MSDFKSPTFRVRRIEASRFVVEMRAFGLFWCLCRDESYGVSETLNLTSERAALDWIDREVDRLLEKHLSDEARRQSFPVGDREYRVVSGLFPGFRVQRKGFLRWRDETVMSGGRHVPLSFGDYMTARSWIARRCGVLDSAPLRGPADAARPPSGSAVPGSAPRLVGRN